MRQQTTVQKLAESFHQAFHYHPLQSNNPDFQSTERSTQDLAESSSGLRKHIFAGVESAYLPNRLQGKSPSALLGIWFEALDEFKQFARQGFESRNLVQFYGKQFSILSKGLEPFFTSAPWLNSMNAASSVLWDQIAHRLDIPSLRQEAPFHPVASFLTSTGLYINALYSKSWSPLLQPMVQKGAEISLQAAARVGMLGWIGQAANAAGIAGIANMFAEFGKWAVNRHEGVDREKNPALYLEKIVYDTELRQICTGRFGETIGTHLNYFLGHLVDGILTGAELFSDQVRNGREIQRSRVRNSLVQSTRETAQVLSQRLKEMAEGSLNPRTHSIDWRSYQARVREYFSQNQKELEHYFDLSELTEHLAPEVRDLNRLIYRDGYFRDRQGIQSFLLR